MEHSIFLYFVLSGRGRVEMSQMTLILKCVPWHVCICMCAYEQKVTESHSTRGKEVFFLGISGLGCYNRQPTDTASYGSSRN